jgi:ribonuclease Y
VKQRDILDNAKKEAENLKKEEILKAKEEALKVRNELDEEIKERRSEVGLQEKRIIQKEENLEKRSETFEHKEKDLDKKLQEADTRRKNLDEIFNKQIEELQRISGLSKDEAKTILLEQLDKKLSDEKAVLIKEYENKMKEESSKIGKEMVGYAIQKCAADHTSETTVSIVALPNDDMKGRIIGREGRNIKTLRNTNRNRFNN